MIRGNACADAARLATRAVWSQRQSELPQRHGYAQRVKRHAALVPLSHDHHHALVAARRLRRGADSAEPAKEAAAFLAFFATETVPHFREEEELLLPHVANREEAHELIVAALLDHQRLHALALQLSAVLRSGSPDPVVMHALGELLEAHVRREEQELFPLIERLLTGETLDGLVLRENDAISSGAEAVPSEASGPIWGTSSEELNATLLSWNVGEGPPEHVNDERDVLVVVLEGSMTLRTDEGARELSTGESMIIAKGQRRKITAGPDGARYMSVHRRRGPLQMGYAHPPPPV
jgi:quercetin dioxygenase-like cupin family protein/hemerythrin-like domain-containing protein